MKYFFKKKEKNRQEPSLTLYLTEETAGEFMAENQTAVKEPSENHFANYGKRLQYSSNVLVAGICFLLAGMCYLQWQMPPQVLQYEQVPELEKLEQPLAVDVQNDGLFASMTIAVCDYDNLEEAYLLVNGEIAGRFSGKQLVVRVYPGDVLEIDTTAYLASCRFQVVKKSSHIREETIETMVTTDKGYGWIGKISFK